MVLCCGLAAQDLEPLLNYLSNAGRRQPFINAPPPACSLVTGRLARSVRHSHPRWRGSRAATSLTRRGGRPDASPFRRWGAGRSGAETDKSRWERSTRHVGEGLETEPKRRWEIAYLWRGPISPDTSIAFSFSFKNTARPIKPPFAWASAVAWRRGGRVRASRAARLDASPGGSLVLTCVQCSAAGR